MELTDYTDEDYELAVELIAEIDRSRRGEAYSGEFEQSLEMGVASIIADLRAKLAAADTSPRCDQHPDRRGAFSVHDDDRGDVDVCAECFGFDDWETEQEKVDSAFAAA